MTATDPTAVRRVLLVAHTGRDDAREVARGFVRALSAHGLLVRLIATEAHEARPGADPRLGRGRRRGGVGQRRLRAGGRRRGDGTILRAAEITHDTGAAVLGVNLGHVGFLAEAEYEDMESTIEAIVARRYTTEDRLTLDVTVHLDGEVVARTWALNEASVEEPRASG